MSQFYTSADHFSIEPAIILALFGCAILLFDFLVFPSPRQRKWLTLLVILAESFAGFGLWRYWAFHPLRGPFGGVLLLMPATIVLVALAPIWRRRGGRLTRRP